MTRNRKYKTSSLFQKASFIQGMASVFNVSGNHYQFKYDSSEAEADCDAIRNDWGMIGEDILNAFYDKNVEREEFKEVSND